MTLLKQNRKLILFFICGLCLLSVTCFGHDAKKELRGKVQKVIDGDSLVLHQGKRDYEVRLWGIDCPEYGQPYGIDARKVSRGLILDKKARIAAKYRDSYGRYVGIVYQKELNVNEELIRQGAAWVYNRYCREDICNDWRLLQEQAQLERRGLWNSTQQVAPWKWRRYNH